MVSIKSVLDLLAFATAVVGSIPLFPYLENAPRLLFTLALVTGGVADWKGIRIRGWIPTVGSLLFFIYYAGQFSRENLVLPAVSLIVVLLSARLVSEKSPRNYLQICALSLFALTSSTLFTLSPLFLVSLFMMFALITVSLVMLTYYVNATTPLITLTGLEKTLAVGLTMAVVSLPLMVFLFFLLPRTQFPLWQFLNVGGPRESGFSERVEPGSAAAVAGAKRVAFRAECCRIPVEWLYWRGIVLNSFQGIAWVRNEVPPGEEGGVVRGAVIRQVIYPEPGRSAFMPALNVPRAITGIRCSRDSDYVFRAARGVSGRVRYDAVSIVNSTIAPRKEPDRAFYLKVPQRLSSDIAGIARSSIVQGRSDEEKISLLESYFRSRKLVYATSGLPVGEQSLDDFLLGQGRGNCEFFASSAALLLRLAGVPSRLVGGYLGGEFNDLGGYYVVTEEMAHVWVEAYIAGKGWVLVDPSRWAVNFPAARGGTADSYLQRIRLALDAFGYYWNRTVINYDLERQLGVFRDANLRMKRLTPAGGFRLLLRFCGAAVLVMSLLLLKKVGRRSREERILGKFLRAVGKKYRVQLQPGMGLYDLAGTLDDPAVKRFVALYGGAIYRDRKLEPGELRELRKVISGIAASRTEVVRDPLINH